MQFCLIDIMLLRYNLFYINFDNTVETSLIGERLCSFILQIKLLAVSIKEDNNEN